MPIEAPELSTPQETALARWMMQGSSSLNNPLIHEVGLQLLKPFGIDYERLEYDAFSGLQGDNTPIILVGPKLDTKALSLNPSCLNIWAPALPVAAAIAPVIKPPFEIYLMFNPSLVKDPEQLHQFEEAMAQGFEEQLNAAYDQFLTAAKAAADLCLASLVSGDKEAIDTYLRDPRSLLALMGKRVSA